MMTSMVCSVLNFYKFVELEPSELGDLRNDWLREARHLGLLGTILLAPEGVNGALAGSQKDLEAFFALIGQHPHFRAIAPKWSQAQNPPFRRLEVKIKRWIIRFAEQSDPHVGQILTAPRMSPAEVRQKLEDSPEDFLVIDTRNIYETDCGMFEDAIRLPIKTFTEFPEAFLKTFAHAKNKTLLFYCTGGVRCEKVVPWAVEQGFTKATQLDGGILKYFEEVGTNGYKGHCFVFDDRHELDGDRIAVDGASH